MSCRTIYENTHFLASRVSGNLVKASKYVRNIDIIDGIYWRFRGTRPVTIHGQTVEFRTDSIPESIVVDFSVHTEGVVVANLLEELHSDDVFFDVGANYGFYSCFAASVIGGNRVYAFEPNPLNIERLRRNHELNGTSGVHIVEKALSDSIGEVPFDRPSWYRTWSGTSGIRDPEKSSYSVEAITGDALCRQVTVSTPSVLKIDVEGAEMRVLRGCSDTLSEPECRAVFCEIHSNRNGLSLGGFDTSASQAQSFLENRGFMLQTLQEREDVIHLKGLKE